MVAIVTGAGLGLDQSSLKLLGSQGALGSASFGTNDESVYVNAANGNLVVERTDEILTGIGPTDSLSLAYNSLSSSTGYGANNNWQTNDSRAVYGLSGTVDTSGSYVYRNAGDGSVDTYYWNATDSAYVCTQAGNAANRLTYSSSGNTWTWTDGTDQTVEVYDASNGGRIVSSADANGNTLTYSYTGSLLTKVTTADGEYTQLSYTGSNLTGITAYYYANAAAQASNTFSTQSSTSYTYDSSNRLSTVTTTASTGDTVVTTYGYSGTSDLITSISQTGGAQLTINYTTLSGNNVVSSLVQTDSTGVTSTTSFSYSSGTTSITDNNGNVTQLTYNGSGQLTNVQLPPAQSGATAQSMSYTYNSDGDVLTATDALGNVTTYTYDSNDNLLTVTDPLGNITAYTYNSDNQILTQTMSGPGGSLTAGNENLIVANIGDTTTFSPIEDDVDGSGAALTITAISTPSHGTATIVDGGLAVQYTRTGAGADSFTYTVTDTNGLTATATVSVADSATASSEPPAAGNISMTVGGVGSTFTFDPRAYASDANGYALTVTSVSSPSLGTATIVDGGTAIDYTRTSDGADSFTYTLSDGHGETATATVSVADSSPPSGAGPTAGNISTTTVGGIGATLTFDPRAYAGDVNNYPLTITSVSSPTYGTATIIDSGTAINYTRTADGADSFTYTLSDGHGGTATATVSMADSGVPVNEAPTAGNVSVQVIGVGSTLTFNPIAYASDVNNYPLTITAVSSPAYGTATIVDGGTAIDYTRTSLGTDSFTYTLSDGHGRTATATISVANSAPPSGAGPTAGNISVAVGGVGASLTFDPRASASDANGYPLTITSVSTPGCGTATINGGGTAITYTRTALGIDSFTYTLSDGHGGTATATVSVANYTVQPPVAAHINVALSLANGSSLTFDPIAYATGNGLPLTITAVSTPTKGTATIVDGGTAITYTRTTADSTDSFTYTLSDGCGHTSTATVSVAASGSSSQLVTANNVTVASPGTGNNITFNPLATDANFLAYGMTITSVSTPTHGTATIVDSGTEIEYAQTGGTGVDSFTYTISDGDGHTATATVYVGDQPPTANNFSIINAVDDGPITFDPRAECSDVNNYPLTITAVSTPSHGTATIVDSGTAIKYTKSTTGTDSFTYTISDGHGGTATATITVEGVAGSTAQVITANNTTVTSPGTGSNVTFSPLASDYNLLDDAMTITSVSTPSNGTATIVDSGAEIEYAQTGGTGNDNFTYTISDGDGHTSTATVYVSNGFFATQVVTANNVTVSSPGSGNNLTINPLSIDANLFDYAMTITSVSTPSHGTATIIDSGTEIQYSQTSAGADSFTYTISDGHGNSATATITVASSATATQLVTANNQTENSPGAGNSTTFDPLVTDANFLAYGMTITSVSTPTHGTATIVDSGTEIQYAQTGGTGSDSFTYTISDGHGNTSTATVTMADGVGPSQLVTANNDSVIVNGVGNSLTINPLATDANFLAYGMTITSVSTPSYGTASIVSGGTGITYTRTGNGNDSFTYTISDGHGGTATATIFVSTGITAPQVVTAGNQTVTVNAVGDAATFHPLLDDANLLVYSMTITSISSPSHGTASIVSGGTGITYTRTSAGADSFIYTMSDGHGDTATATVTIESLPASGGTTVTSGPSTRYVYDSKSNLDFAITPDGEVTQYIYNSYGQQTSAITYTNNAYNLSGLSPNAAPSLTTMNSWVAGISNLSTIQRADTTYDFRGNVATETNYSACNATTGAGLTTSPYTVTTYSYDPHGNLLSKQTYNSAQTNGVTNSEVYVYDALNRVTSATNLEGGTTTIQYNDSSNTVVTTSPTGLTTTSVYNDVGQLISTAESGTNFTTTTTTFQYDSLGNLCMVTSGITTSGTGNTSYFLYDNTGRKVAAIAADGSLAEYKYNADDQLVATVAYATKLTSTQLASLVNFSGNPTDPAISTITPAASSGDIWSWRVYDNDNRLIETIDGDGDATVYGYDVFSNLISTTSYANPLSSSAVTGFKTTPPTTLQLPAADPGVDRVTRSFYNNEEQVIATLDANGYLTQSVYNDAGQQTETIASATQASSSFWASGTLAQLQTSVGTSSGDIITQYVYDDRGLLVYTLNSALQPTQYVYDDAGHLVTKTAYDGTIASESSYSAASVASAIAGTSGLATNANNQTTYYVYDATTGTLDYAIDALGDVTQYKYDANGNVIKQTQFATQDPQTSLPTQATMDSWASANASDTSNQVTRSVYNVAGQLVYSVNALGYVTQYGYDADGHMTSQIQYSTLYSVSDGVTQASLAALIGSPSASTYEQMAYSYNANGQLSDTFNALGIDTHLTYDAQGQVTSSTFAYGTSNVQETQYSYDAAGRLTDTINALGTDTRLTYNAFGDAATSTLAYGTSAASETQYTYNTDDQLTDATNALGADTHQTYNAFGDVTSSTLAYGTSAASETQYTYNAENQLTDTTNALSIDTHLVYDAFGRVTQSTVASGTSSAAATAYTYNDLNQLVSETQAYGQAEAATTGYTYDAFGNTLTETDPDGHTTTYTYDKVGQALTSTDATGAVTTNTYDAFGNLLTTTNALGNIAYFFYDQLNRLTLEIDPMGYATATAYTNTNQIASVTHYATVVTGTITPGTAPTVTTSSNDATTAFSRDLLGRVTSETDADGNTQSYTYDARGDVLTYTNQLGGETTYSYDALGHMLSETLPETSTLANGTVQATSVTNTYSYDLRGNRIQMIEASGLAEQRITNYTYDALNRLLTTTLVANTGQSFQLVANNLSTSSVSSITTATNTYDARGNLIETVDALGNATYFYYDHLNRQIATINALGTLSETAYDAAGNVTATTVYGTAVTLPSSPGGTPPSGSGTYRQTTYTYDHDNRLLTTTVASVLTGAYSGSTFTTSTGNVTTTNTYDAVGDLVEQTNGLGQSIFTYYDKSGRKIAQVDQDNYLTTWTLDQNGNVLTEDRYATQLSSTPTTSSNPATLASSIGSSSNDRITTFTYDKNGNRLTETREGVVSWTINATTGVLTAGSTNSTITYTYNGLGEVTSQTQATGDATTYSYDSEGRQTKIQLSAYTGASGSSVQNTTSETYDGLNDLTRTSEYDALNGATPAEVTEYTYGPGGRLATMTNADGFTRNYGYDADGHTMMVSYARLQSNGTTVTEADTSEYDALGRQVFQAVASDATGSWVFGDEYTSQYDAYGEVTGTFVNGVQQQSYSYDNAGRLWAATTDNGTTQLYMYDAAGNRTLTIASSGQALPSGDTWSSLSEVSSVSTVLAILTNSGANAIGAADVSASGMIMTFTTYDGRGQALATIEPFRELSANTSGGYNTATLTQSNIYDAFGDVVQTTDANGNVTNNTYSTLGKLIQQQLPTVSCTSQTDLTSTARPTTTYYYDISGRQIGVEDANGNTTTQSLLANTGYEGSTALVVKTFDAIVGDVSTNGYDVFGNVITATNQDGDVTTNTYDAMNQLMEQADPVRPAETPGNPTSSAVQLINYYAYDGLGQRIASSNNQLDSTGLFNTGGTLNTSVTRATTDYDLEGRVIKQVDLAGNITTYAYSWSGTASTTGLGTFGGWTEVTTNPGSLTESVTTDSFGHTIAKTDFGGTVYAYTYNLDGGLTQQLNETDQSSTTTVQSDYTYFNTGLLATGENYQSTLDHTSGIPHIPYYAIGELLSTYAYDANGNRLVETTSQIDSGYEWSTTTSLEDATATYDALNRVTSLSDTGGDNGTIPMSTTWQYDLSGNVRDTQSTFYYLTTSGTAVSSSSTQSNWFLYDSMNRVVLADGTFVGSAGSGSIQLGTNTIGVVGTGYAYDAAGNRVTSTTIQVNTNAALGTVGDLYQSEELYSYTADGYLAQVNVANGDVYHWNSSVGEYYDDDTHAYVTTAPIASGTGTLQANYKTDAMGRVTLQQEYNSAGTSVVYSKTATYDNDSNVLTDQITTVESSGSVTLVQGDTYQYGAYNSTSGLYNGAYQGGNVMFDTTTLTDNGTSEPTSTTANTYIWTDQALQNTITFTPNTAAPSTTYVTQYGYDVFNDIISVGIYDGTPRDIDYTTNLAGQILSSSNTEGPQSVYYFFNGVQQGEVTNNGTLNMPYDDSVAQQTSTPGSGFYMNGATSGTNYASFGTQSESINGLGNQSATTPNSYTVQLGDTLQSIAQAIWGDSSFWYLIADANGLSGNAQLQAGQTLVIPNDVANSQDNSTTNTVYDAYQAIGNTAPTHAPPPPKHSSGCGVFGEVIETIISVAVTVVTGDPVLGDLAAQTVGLATGIQSKFNWNELGEAVIADLLDPLPATDPFVAALEAIAASAATQGISLALGLQKQFDWAGVAAAGVTAGLNAQLGVNAEQAGANGQPAFVNSPLENAGLGLVAGAAGTIAGAAIRSLSNGSDFGDNILRYLPNTIGNTVGAYVAAELGPNYKPPFSYQSPWVNAAGSDIAAGVSWAENAVGLTSDGSETLNVPPQPGAVQATNLPAPSNQSAANNIVAGGSSASQTGQAPAPPSPEIYTVVPNDTVSDIADGNYAQIGAIVAANHLQLAPDGSPIITVGQNLVIPNISGLDAGTLSQLDSYGRNLVAYNAQGIAQNEAIVAALDTWQGQDDQVLASFHQSAVNLNQQLGNSSLIPLNAPNFDLGSTGGYNDASASLLDGGNSARSSGGVNFSGLGTAVGAIGTALDTQNAATLGFLEVTGNITKSSFGELQSLSDGFGWASFGIEVVSESFKTAGQIQAGAPVDNALVGGLGRVATSTTISASGALAGFAIGELIEPLGGGLVGAAILGGGSGATADYFHVPDMSGNFLVQQWQSTKPYYENNPEAVNGAFSFNGF